MTQDNERSQHDSPHSDQRDDERLGQPTNSSPDSEDGQPEHQPAPAHSGGEETQISETQIDPQLSESGSGTLDGTVLQGQPESDSEPGTLIDDPAGTVDVSDSDASDSSSAIGKSATIVEDQGPVEEPVDPNATVIDQGPAGDDPDGTVIDDGSSSGSDPDGTVIESAIGSSGTHAASNIEHTLVEQWENSISDSDTPECTIKQVDFGQTADLDQTAVELSDPASDEFPASSETSSSRTGSTIGNLSVTLKSREFSNSPQGEQPAEGDPDYNIERLLGEGGIGAVYSARQLSMGRSVAVKVLKPNTAQMTNSQEVFVSEAVITGSLDHPNIIPIYDVGQQSDTSPFYAMKQVHGVEWAAKIDEYSLEENLNVLLRVADAVAFAHSRHIIHRDLKPANVMLGEFGEVLVMDWGLAIPTDKHPAKAEFPRARPGGTPCYMAPEMAMGSASNVDERSDIYLLGGILYRAIVGVPPHRAETVRDCLIAAAENEIYDPSLGAFGKSLGKRAERPEPPAEIREIALKAMATDPADRFQSIQEFQAAIRQFIAHSESLALLERANADLERAAESKDYQDFAKALFGYQDAVELWDGNVAAKEGVGKTSLAYAETATENGDFDLATTLLDRDNDNHQTLLARIAEERAERDSRLLRLKRAKQARTIAVATLFVVLSVSALWINSERNEAIEQREAAESAQLQAEIAKDEADIQRKRAETNLRQAEVNLLAAQKARKEAEAAQKLAVAAEAEARKEATTAKAVSRFLVGMFEGSDPLGLHGFGFGVTEANRGELTAKQLLEQGAEKIVDQLKDEPAAQATLMHAIGNSFRSLAQFKKARRLIEESLRIRRKLYQGDHPEIAESLQTLGWLIQDEGDYPKAIEIYRETLAMRERLAGVNSPSATQTMFQLAWVLGLDSQHAEAEKLMNQVIENRKKHEGPEHRSVGLALAALAGIQLHRGDSDMKIMGTTQEAIRILLKNEGTKNVGAVAGSVQQAMVMHRVFNNPKGALPKYEAALETGRKLLGATHPYVIAMTHEYANCLFDLDRRQEAGDALRWVWKEGIKFAPAWHPKLLIAARSLGDVLEVNGKLSEALQLYEDVYPVWKKKNDESGGEELREDLVVLHVRAARIARKLSLWEKSRDHMKRLLETRSENKDPTKELQLLGDHHSSLGYSQYRCEQFADARASLEKALTYRDDVLEKDRNNFESIMDRAVTFYRLAILDVAETRFDEAIAKLESIVADCTKIKDDEEFKKRKVYAANLKVFGDVLARTKREKQTVESRDFALTQEPDEQWKLLNKRIDVLAKRGEFDKAASEIEPLLELITDENHNTGGKFVDVARRWGMLIKQLNQQAPADQQTDEQKKLVEEATTKALSAIRAAIEKGWANAAALSRYRELEPLRELEQFQNLVEKIQQDKKKEQSMSNDVELASS